ncbi:TPA: CehA/McbA family metallohydrolase [Thermoplasmata archaeon]|nr:CehA/McbA family metallohydrolase [Thermoplasmata archaeon]
MTVGKLVSAVSLAVIAFMIAPSFCSTVTAVEEEPVMEYNLYFGDLHSHTSYSDGEGTPDEAFAAARAAGADFLALTDHHYLLLDWEWADTLSSADDHTVDGEFVAIAGYEYFLAGINEINIYGTTTLPPDAGLVPQAYYKGDRMTGGSFFPWIYDWIAEEPGAIGQWNHPLSYGCPVCWDFYQFDFWNEERDLAMGMLECYNWGDRSSSYIKALDAGWHMMPTATADDHYGEWISGSEVRTVLLAPSLSREDLYEAMRDGRGYATQDSNLEIRYTLEGAVMGSVLHDVTGVTAGIHIVDPDGVDSDAITLVEIVTNGGVVVASQEGDGSCVFDWDASFDAEGGSYYFVRVHTESNELGLPGVTAWTAPVWVEA